MINYILQGFLFGIAYVAPIGAQNLYVINSALVGNSKRVIQTVFMVVFFDISLALSCYFGIGLLLEKFQVIKGAVLLLGCIIIFHMGLGLLKKNINEEIKRTDNRDSFMKILVSSFSVAWLNPQAIIDGTLLLGGFRTSIDNGGSPYFMSGVCCASAIWFSFLAIFTYFFFSKFTKAIIYINKVCGIILMIYGIKLGYSLVMMFDL